jgi:hypothetical protein
MIPQVRNVRDVGKRTNDRQVYVGRRTKWGNPFRIGEHGTREEVIALHKEVLEATVAEDPTFLEPLRALLEMANR